MYKVPLPLIADAYTIGSEDLESTDAINNSEYYLTFRKFPFEKEPMLFSEGDNRIVFSGLQRQIRSLFGTPVTHADIDESIKFLKDRCVGPKGFSNFPFSEKKWREVVDIYGGYVPLVISGLPEGSVCYPNEPVIRVKNAVPGFGQFAAMFEASLVKVWARTARLTAARHWLEKMTGQIMSVDKCSYAEAQHIARMSVHDFGDRAGMTDDESCSLG